MAFPSHPAEVHTSNYPPAVSLLACKLVRQVSCKLVCSDKVCYPAKFRIACPMRWLSECQPAAGPSITSVGSELGLAHTTSDVISTIAKAAPDILLPVGLNTVASLRDVTASIYT